MNTEGSPNSGRSGTAVTFRNAGTFSATVYADYSGGSVPKQSPSVTVTATPPPPTNQLPIAVITGPTSATEGTNITFSGTSSYDPDGSISAYLWSTNPVVTLNPSSTASSISLTVPAGFSTMAISLRVTDNQGANRTTSSSVSITSAPPPPPSAPTITGAQWSPSSITAGGSSTISWTTTNATSSTFSVTGGDPSSGSNNTSVTFSSSGTYTATITAIGPGGTDYAYPQINVGVPAPSIPSNLRLLTTSIDKLSVTVGWTRSTGSVSYYEVQANDINPGLYDRLDNVGDNATYTYEYTVPSGGVYEFKVRAVGPGGTSGWSNTLFYTT